MGGSGLHPPEWGHNRLYTPCGMGYRGVVRETGLLRWPLETPVEECTSFLQNSYHYTSRTVVGITEQSSVIISGTNVTDHYIAMVVDVVVSIQTDVHTCSVSRSMRYIFIPFHSTCKYVHLLSGVSAVSGSL